MRMRRSVASRTRTVSALPGVAVSRDAASLWRKTQFANSDKALTD